jgi:hypothetical protein
MHATVCINSRESALNKVKTFLLFKGPPFRMSISFLEGSQVSPVCLLVLRTTGVITQYSAKWNTPGKTCPADTSSTTRLKWTVLGLNPGLNRNSPIINRFRRDTVWKHNFDSQTELNIELVLRSKHVPNRL